jgi:hypothetical protein
MALIKDYDIYKEAKQALPPTRTHDGRYGRTGKFRATTDPTWISNHRRQRRPSCNDSVCPLDHAANRNWQLKRYIRIIIRQTEIKRLLVVIKAQRDPSSIDHDDRLNTQSWLSSHFPVATCILQAVCLYPPLSISISNVQSSSSSALLQKP